MIDGKRKMVVSATTAAVLDGKDDMTSWSDEELLRGQRRSKRGTWEGKPPAVVPMAIHKELIRRRLVECESIIRESCVHAARYLDQVVRGREEPKSGRQRAAEVMLERFLGKPTERHLVDARVEMSEPPWMEALRKAARTIDGRPVDGRPVINTTATRTDGDIVEAEVIEDNPLCACGCGQPPRSGSAYFNGRHQRHAEAKVQRHPEPSPTWSESDPVLEDDEDFVEELDDDPDDPVLW